MSGGIQKVFLCEDTAEGVFSGVHAAYESRHGHSRCRLLAGAVENYELFCEYIEVKSDAGKAESVSHTIRRRLGEEAYTDIFQALASDAPDKADAVYKTIVLGLAGSVKGSIMAHLGNPHVARVFALSRQTFNESHHLLGFVRFEELSGGILYSEIGPRCNALPFLAPHFADRLPGENFILYDRARRLAAIHEADKEWLLVSNADIPKEAVAQHSESEAYYRELFCTFCSTIAIEARENRALQRQMLPLRFQKFMVEFAK